MLCMTPRRTDLASLRPHPLRQAHGGEPDHATVSSGRSRYLRGDERFQRQRPLLVPFQHVAPMDVSHPRHWASVHAPGWRALERHSLVGNTKRGTMAELGYPRVAGSVWYGLMAPAGTPKKIIAMLNAESNRILATQEVKDRMAGAGIDAAGGTPEEFGN